MNDLHQDTARKIMNDFNHMMRGIERRVKRLPDFEDADGDMASQISFVICTALREPGDACADRAAVNMAMHGYNVEVKSSLLALFGSLNPDDRADFVRAAMQLCMHDMQVAADTSDPEAN